ncbi:hypothetical protein DL95DRAFT_500442 [Leptodontidium sp. 2 PMI_412]|nr:hypothetical protein DL95DRAFT_500442 [Leptodontidium sp. 2 PMI_412]
MRRVTTNKARNAAWVVEEEQSQNPKHEYCIKHVERPLMCHQVPIRASNVLNNPKQTPDHDEPTDKVQHVHHLLPLSPGRRHHAPLVPLVKLNSRNAKQAKDSNLEYKTTNDDPLAKDREVRPRAVRPKAGYCQTTSTTLNIKRNTIAREEYFYKAKKANKIIIVAIKCDNNTTEHHINKGGEKNK